MSAEKVVVGVYTYLDDTINAIDYAKQAKLEFKAYAPFYNHELDVAASPVRSNVRFVTGTGAVTGLISGFALAILCSLDWPMRTSAKDVVSIPGFVVIGYEWTILFGALATLAALLFFCKIPNILKQSGFDPRFTQDKFGIAIGCESDQAEEVRGKLVAFGAEDVDVREAI